MSAAPTPTVPIDEPAASTRNHLEALTGLRLIAALAVYLSHVSSPKDASEIVTTFLRSGYMGVTVFFVLSGFVLSLNYGRRLARPSGRGLATYAIARFARIYPLYVLVLIFAMVNSRITDDGSSGWPLHFLALQAWSGDLSVAQGYNRVAWSISVEFLLYAALPLLLLGLARVRSARAIVVTMTGVATLMLLAAAWFVFSERGDLPATDAGSAYRWLYLLPPARLGDFALGVLAARLYLLVRDDERVRRAGPWLVGSMTVLILALMAWPAHLLTPWSYDVSYAIPATLVIFGLAVSPAGLLARALSVRVVVLLGEASFAFYLIHALLIGKLEAGRWFYGMTPMNLLYDAFALGFILCTAVGLHLLIERPARNWIKAKGPQRPASQP